MSNPPVALDMDATPQAGGSYLRQPDGALVRATTGQVAASPVARPEPATPTLAVATSDKKE